MIRTEPSINVASKNLVDTFIKWNQFFRRLESKTYSENTIVGIWGELFILNRLVEKETRPNQINRILEAWTGPLDSVHDFNFEDKSIEVKTKLSSKSSINIASEFQLELSSAEYLELCVLNIVKEDEGESIETLYKNLKVHILNYGADFPLLLTRLIALRLDEQNLGRYNKYRYRALEAIHYDCLDEAFPKIVRNELDDEIFSVKYKLDVSALKKFILNTEKY